MCSNDHSKFTLRSIILFSFFYKFQIIPILSNSIKLQMRTLETPLLLYTLLSPLFSLLILNEKFPLYYCCLFFSLMRLDLILVQLYQKIKGKNLNFKLMLIFYIYPHICFSSFIIKFPDFLLLYKNFYRYIAKKRKSFLLDSLLKTNLFN